MATILLVEDVLDIGSYEAGLLEDRGHRVIICRGGPASFSMCPLIRDGSCSIADEADMLLFSSSLYAPVGLQAHTGLHLLRRYRAHPDYGTLPCLVVAVGNPGSLPGSGPIRTIGKFAPAREVVAAVDALLAVAGDRTRR